MRKNDRFRHAWLMGVVSLVGCGSGLPPRPVAPLYVVTATPIDIGLGSGLCVAVDRADAAGVWWWHPGAAGCTTRSTGPTVLRAQGASVAKSGAEETVAVSFEIPTQSTVRPLIEVRMVVGEQEMRVLHPDSRVAATVRHDLDIPEVPIRGREPVKQIRALLEQRYQGMSGEGAVLRVAATIVEIEAAEHEEMKTCERCRQVPINYSETSEWTDFKTTVRAGDTLVYFRTSFARWAVQGGAEGYAIVRNGELVRSFLIAQS